MLKTRNHAVAAPGRFRPVRWAIPLAALWLGAFPAAGDAGPGLLLVETDKRPRLSLTCGRGTFSKPVEYTAPGDPVTLGDGLTGYVALGGVRLEANLGNPVGASVRFGFTRDHGAGFLEAGSDEPLVIELSGVVFNAPIEADERSLMVHLRLDDAGVGACGLRDRDRAWIVTLDPDETLGDRLKDGWNARLGALGGADVSVEVDGAELSVRVSMPPALLKHPRDPWLTDEPGLFSQPEHFHVELEVRPLAAETERSPRPDEAE